MLSVWLLYEFGNTSFLSCGTVYSVKISHVSPHVFIVLAPCKYHLQIYYVHAVAHLVGLLHKINLMHPHSPSSLISFRCIHKQEKRLWEWGYITFNIMRSESLDHASTIMNNNTPFSNMLFRLQRHLHSFPRRSMSTGISQHVTA